MSINKTILSGILIVFLVLFYGINNCIWLQNVADIPDVDESMSYQALMYWVKAIENRDFITVKAYLSLEESVYVPVYFVPSMMSYFIFKTGYHVHVMHNVLFFGLLLIALYLLAKHLFNTSTAFLALMIVSLYPGIYYMSRKFHIEFGLMWIVVISVYFLLKSDFFTKRNFSVISGIALGIGLMTKPSFPLFVFPLFFYCVFVGFKKALIDKKKKVFVNVFLLCALSCIIAGHRYLRPDMLRMYGITRFFHEPRGEPIYQYIIYFYERLLQPYYFILFIIAAIWFMKYEKRELKVIFLWWFLPAILYFSFMFHGKETRYILPLLPVMGLISARAIDAIKWKKVKYCVIGICLVYGLAQYYVTSFHYYDFPFAIIKPSAGNIEGVPRKNVINTVVENLNDLDIHYTNNFTFLMLKVVQHPLSEDILSEASNPSTWKFINWSRGLPFTISMLENYIDGIDVLVHHLIDSEGIIYLGMNDLKDEEEFESYMEFLCLDYYEYTGSRVNGEPVKIVPLHEIQHIQFIKDFNDFQTKFKNNFSDFTLHTRIQVNNATPPLYMYVYKRR